MVGKSYASQEGNRKRIRSLQGPKVDDAPVRMVATVQALHCGDAILHHSSDQQFKPLCLQRAEEEGYAREIAAWLVKTLHQAKVNRIASRDEDDWSGRGRRHGGWPGIDGVRSRSRRSVQVEGHAISVGTNPDA